MAWSGISDLILQVVTDEHFVSYTTTLSPFIFFFSFYKKFTLTNNFFFHLPILFLIFPLKRVCQTPKKKKKNKACLVLD